MGQADDIGGVVAALASDELGWATDQHIKVNGGYGLHEDVAV
jgi:hypothetical protein